MLVLEFIGRGILRTNSEFLSFVEKRANNLYSANIDFIRNIALNSYCDRIDHLPTENLAAWDLAVR